MPEEEKDLIQRIENYLHHQDEVFGNFFINWDDELSQFEAKESVEESDQTADTPESKTTPPSPPAVSIHPGEENDEAFAKKSKPEPTGLFSQENAAEESTPATREQKPEAKKPGMQEELAACSDLDELKQLCIKYQDRLKTDLEGANLVFGVGNPNADLVIVGEAPGEEEDKRGEPFVGAAGQLLDKIMGAIKFTRDDIYIANILKFRPPDNRNPKPEECRNSLPFLERQIDLIQPKVILCVGKFAAITLLGKTEQTSLSSLRGTFHLYRSYPLLATYHPAALLRNEKWKRPTWEDVKMLRRKYDELTT